MPDPRVCVFGNGACARDIAEKLLAAGARVVLASAEGPADLAPAGKAPALEHLAGVRLETCHGGLGRFELVFSGAGAEIRRTAAAVVIAEDGERRPQYAAHGLAPAAGIVPISRLAAAGQSLAAHPAAGSQVAFLNGLFSDTRPLIAGEMMAAALNLRRAHGAACTFLTRHLNVAADGLEALSHEARSAGVRFFKFDAALPRIRQGSDGRVHLAFVDETTGVEFALAPALVVLEETVVPSAEAARLARLFELETDAGGFLQADNVRRLTVETNRRGVFVAGAARDAGLESAIEAANAVLAALWALDTPEAGDPRNAAIEPGSCIRCLTCLRLCPHRAVVLDGRPQVWAAACERCGICAAECPRGAIRIPGLESAHVRGLVAAGLPSATGGAPLITAFCCTRSAAPALEAARCAGHRWEGLLNVIEVPCAGSISPEFILAALTSGCDGVLILTCHDDNCHSRQGSRLARSRTAQVAEFLARRGGPPQRLVLKTLAANMATELAAAVAELCADLTGRRAQNSRPEPAKEAKR